MGDVGIQGRVLNYVLWHTILASCSGFHLLMSAYLYVSDVKDTLAEFTTHSIRRSAARWTARCGANDSSIKRAG